LDSLLKKHLKIPTLPLKACNGLANRELLFPLHYVVIPKGIPFCALELTSVILSERSDQHCPMAKCCWAI
jgi:hypothetical protein